MSFEFGGDWALLRLIEGYKAIHAPWVDPLDARRLILEFNVPTVRTGSGSAKAGTAAARLYLGLNLSAIDPTTQAPVAVIWPGPFPRSAPTQ